MTRLDVLCKLHGQQGGTIFQFNSQYGIDFLAMSNFQFKMSIASKFGYEKTYQYEAFFPTADISQISTSNTKESQNETQNF